MGVRTRGIGIKAALSGWNLSWAGLWRNQQGEWWLLGQGVLILAVIILPGWPQSALADLNLIWRNCLMISGGSLLTGGVVLAVASFLALGDNLSPLPEPKPGIQLVQSGPYRLCRHPLYLAVLICAAGVMLMRQSPLHLALLIALAMTLRGKAKREEQGLVRRHSDYSTLFSGKPAILAWIPGLNWSIEDAS